MIRSAGFVVVALSVFRLLGYFTEPKPTDAQIHAVTGEPAGAAPGRIDRRSIRVATWNIERGVKFQLIADALRSFEPDIVLLQEVDRYCRRSGNRDVARDLARVLGMNWVAAAEFQEIGEASGVPAALTGQAILSRDAIVDPIAIVFQEQARHRWRLNPIQPRRGGRIALRARTAGLTVYSLHLESGSDDELRTSQLNDVLADAGRQDRHIVIAGDFNNKVGLQSFVLSALGTAGFADALGQITVRQTSVNYRHPIDWLFVKGATARAGRVERIEETSDHYPLVATLSIP